MQKKFFLILLVFVLLAVPALAVELWGEGLPVQAFSIKSEACAQSLQLYPAKATLYVGADGTGQSMQLLATAAPEEAGLPFVWSSSRSKVASVDENGLVTAHKTGTAIITCRAGDGSGLKKTCRITVKPQPPTSLAIEQGEKISLTQDRQVQLTAIVGPENAVNKKVTWKSSKSGVAKVNSAGLVTAVKPGTAVITCKTRTGGLAARITVEVGYGDTDIYYLAIGQADYVSATPIPAAHDDALRFTRTLQSCNFGQKSISGETRMNLSGAQLRQALMDLPSQGMDENDVTYLYYTGHGMGGGSQAYRGALVGVNYGTASAGETLITVDDVRRYLDKVPGKVIVVLDCCLAGQYVSAKGEEQPLSQRELEEAANDMARMFQSGSVQSKGLQSLIENNPLKSKYKIVVSCKSMQLSYSINGYHNNYSVFTRYICEGAGVTGAETGDITLSGSLPADTNKDGMVSVTELKKYAAPKISRLIKQKVGVNQTMVTWPATDSFAVFGRVA